MGSATLLFKQCWTEGWHSLLATVTVGGSPIAGQCALDVRKRPRQWVWALADVRPIHRGRLAGRREANAGTRGSEPARPPRGARRPRRAQRRADGDRSLRPLRGAPCYGHAREGGARPPGRGAPRSSVTDCGSGLGARRNSWRPGGAKGRGGRWRAAALGLRARHALQLSSARRQAEGGARGARARRGPSRRRGRRAPQPAGPSAARPACAAQTGHWMCFALSLVWLRSAPQSFSSSTVLMKLAKLGR